MWSWNGLTVPGTGRKDDALARYARWEYGDDGAWFVAQARREARSGRGEGLLSKLARLFRHPAGEGGLRSTDSPPCRTASDGGVLLEVPQETCGHEELEHLGEGGPASYFRCGRCGVLLIAQGGSLWTLARGPGPSP